MADVVYQCHQPPSSVVGFSGLWSELEDGFSGELRTSELLGAAADERSESEPKYGFSGELPVVGY